MFCLMFVLFVQTSLADINDMYGMCVAIVISEMCEKSCINFHDAFSLHLSFLVTMTMGKLGKLVDISFLMI